jgi:plasmid stabilization system protein ParE
MGFKIIWSDAAVADLEEVCSYIAQDDPEATNGVAQGILDHVDIPVHRPYISARFKRYASSHSFSFLPHPLSVNEGRESVEILNIWHGARDEQPFQQNTSTPS